MIDCGIGNVDATSTHKKTQVNTAFESRISLRRTEKPFSREGMHFSQFRIRSILVMGKWFCHELRHFVNKYFFTCKQIKIKELHYWITTIWTHFLLSWKLFRGKKLTREKCVATRNVEKLFVQSFDVCLNASHILWKWIPNSKIV